MSEHYDRATGSPGHMDIQGKRYLVGRYTPRDFGDLNGWLKEQWPDPRLKARELCQGMSDAVALQIWNDLKEEAKDWPLSIENGRGEQLFYTTHEGAAMLLWVRLRRFNPSVTLEVAREMAKDITDEDLRELVRRGFPEETWLPKGEPLTTTTAISPMASDDAA